MERTVSTAMLHRLPPTRQTMRIYTLLPPWRSSSTIRHLHTTPLLSLPIPRRRGGKTFNRSSDSEEPSRGQIPRQRGGRGSPSSSPSFLPEHNTSLDEDSTDGNIHRVSSPEVQRLQELLPDEPFDYEDGLTDAEIEYLTAKAEREHGVPIPYEPIGLSTESSTSTFSDLSDLRPELARSKEGLQETLESKIRKLAKRRVDEYIHESDLAFRLLKGKKVLFESEDEKERVLKEAKELLEKREYWRTWRRLKKESEKRNRGGRDSARNERRGESVKVYEVMRAKKEVGDVQIQPVDDVLKGELLDKFVGGDYTGKITSGGDKEGDGGQKDDRGVLDSVRRMTAINGTYDVRDQKLLMEKIRGVLSFGGIGGGGSTTTTTTAAAAAGGGGGSRSGGAGNVRGAGGNQNQRRVGGTRTVRAR